MANTKPMILTAHITTNKRAYDMTVLQEMTHDLLDELDQSGYDEATVIWGRVTVSEPFDVLHAMLEGAEGK